MKHKIRLARIESQLQPGDQFYLEGVWIGDQPAWTNHKPSPPGLKELEIVIGGPSMPSRSQDEQA